MNFGGTAHAYIGAFIALDLFRKTNQLRCPRERYSHHGKNSQTKRHHKFS